VSPTAACDLKPAGSPAGVQPIDFMFAGKPIEFTASLHCKPFMACDAALARACCSVCTVRLVVGSCITVCEELCYSALPRTYEVIGQLWWHSFWALPYKQMLRSGWSSLACSPDEALCQWEKMRAILATHRKSALRWCVVENAVWKREVV